MDPVRYPVLAGGPHPVVTESFSDLIELLIASRDLSQSDIARLTGVSPSRVSIWRSGKGRPEPRNLERMAEVFGFSYDELMRLCGYRVSESPVEVDPDETELLALFRQVPDDQRPVVKLMLRGLAVQPVNHGPVNRSDGAPDNRRQRVRAQRTGNHEQGGDDGLNQPLTVDSQTVRGFLASFLSRLAVQPAHA